MTSPTQLKYLDAMGIPVWVTRDLVTEHRDNLNQNEALDSISSCNASSTSISTNQNTTSSAQSILHSLDHITPSLKPISENEFESKAHSETQLESNKSEIQVPAGENLVFKSDQHYVFADGNLNADWMVIGYSPERFNGIGREPFAGESGILLENMIRSVGIESPRDDAFFVNIFDFNTNQIQSVGEDFNLKLNRQLQNLINKVNPKLVLLVGQNSAQNLLKSDEPLIIMRSKIHRLKEKNIPCVVTYYPSYLLQKPIDKRKAWNDLKLAMSALDNVS